MRVLVSTVLAMAVVALVACGGVERSEDLRAVEDDQASRYRQFAMVEAQHLARRICRHVPPRILSRALGDAGSPGHSVDPNFVALGLARDVRIRPISLQRAVYDGCVRGAKRRASER
jgi:hypothetical protein